MITPRDTIAASAAEAQSPVPGCGADDANQSPLTGEAIGCTRVSGARRRRLKRRARALRSGGIAGGSLGAGAPSPLSHAWNSTLSRRDLIDLRRSIRGNRITSQAKREAFVALAAQTLVHAGRNARLSVSVCQTLVLMDEMNLRDRLGELFPLDGGHPA